MYYLADFQTKQRVKPKNLVFTGDNNTPWEVIMDFDEITSKVNIDYFRKSPPYVSKYLPFLPVRDYANFVSLGEGATPLIRSSKIGKELGLQLYFKLESQNPTGSFKDRGSAVELTIAQELGVSAIVVASTGNMAASCSCYAAHAQIPCFVFVPEGTPPSKLAQVISYGGRIVQIKGGYSDAAEMAKKVAEELNLYLAGDYAFRVEGHKTAAFELCDQLFFQVPDFVIVPMGCGTNMASYAKGFREYQQMGFIDHLPKLVGVQASGACPIVNSFDKGTLEVEAVSKVDSIASAIAINYPLDGVKALEGIYGTAGEALAVTDQEMLAAQYRLSKEEGLFVETSCAASIAALFKMAERHSLENKKIVCILTGSGLKDPSPILKVALKPPTIAPKVDEFLQLYNNSFFEGKAISLVDRESVVFSTLPSPAAVKEKALEYFNARYDDGYVERIRGFIEKFLLKGKPITFADFQDIIQDALESLKPKENEVLVVEDFDVQTGRNRKSHASVSVAINGERLQAEAEGAGPVDAVISALRNACGSKVTFSLSGYKVAIRSSGTDAVVYVELSLKKDGVVSGGSGTSPDIIQASIEAFQEAYNGFYAQ
ncbi:MAG: threonine synthase [Bdellovibrionota bacterium]